MGHIRAPESRSREDVIGRLRGQLVRVMEGAGASWRAVHLVVDLVHERERLAHTRAALASGENSAVMREAQLAYFRNPGRLIEAGRSGLVRSWTQLLLDATEKVERDELEGQIYAKAAADRDIEDQEFGEAAARLTADRWKD